jgi:hypothetical protein
VRCRRQSCARLRVRHASLQQRSASRLSEKRRHERALACAADDVDGHAHLADGLQHAEVRKATRAAACTWACGQVTRCMHSLRMRARSTLS